jgi:mercuric ion binding protein
MLKSIILAISLVTALSTSIVSSAATQRATLKVGSMTCSSCPITVKKALLKVKGVLQVTTSLKLKQAVVLFDDTQTSSQTLTAATANAGYPSTIINAPVKKR